MLCTTVNLNEAGTARLDCYVLDSAISTGLYKTRPALLVAPGGAYLRLAHKEAEPIAARFLGLGYHVFVLRYPTYVLAPPAKEGGEPVVDADAHQPAQTIAAMRAMAHIHAHAQEWDVDESRIYAMGFSAGANVAGLLAERADDAALLAEAGVAEREARPAGLLLCYPMVSADQLCASDDAAPSPELAAYAALVRRGVFGKDDPTADDYASVDLRRHVRPSLPRTFVWQTFEDSVVVPTETTELVCALQRAGVPVEYHLFERGPHGMGLAEPTGVGREGDVNTAAAAWVELAARWLALDDPGELAHA